MSNELSFYKVPRYSAEARRKIAEKRKARKRWQLSRYPSDKSGLNRLTSELKDFLQEEENEKLKNQLEESRA